MRKRITVTDIPVITKKYLDTVYDHILKNLTAIGKDVIVQLKMKMMYGNFVKKIVKKIVNMYIVMNVLKIRRNILKIWKKMEDMKREKDYIGMEMN